MRKLQSAFLILLAVILLFGMLPMQIAAAETKNDYMSMENAAAYVRKELAEFKTDICFKFFFEDPNHYTDTEIMELFLAEVWKHTGVPDEGDYMRWTFQQWGYDIETTFDGNVHHVSVIGFQPTYNNTAEQEVELEQKLDQVFQSLNLDGKSDYEKVKIIYEYVCANVAYSEEVLSSEANPLLPPDELKVYYSAYGALMLRSATCQGFSSLVYRMMLKAGVDCRMITGDDHGWNIVKLNGKYYYLEPTADSDNFRFDGKLKYFLTGSAAFRTGGSVNGNNANSHEYKTGMESFTPEFLDQYPISVLDYGAEDLLTGNPEDVLGSGNCGNQAQWTLTGDGKLTVSGTGSIWDAPSGTFWNFSQERWDGLNGFITQVEIQDGITAIGEYAFMNCPRLTQVSIASTVKSIGRFAFGLCENLTEITLPDTVKTLGDRAFYQCVRMESATLSAGMREVTQYAFLGCSSLKTVQIPEGIRKISCGAFSYCSSLQGMEIPTSVTTLESLAFLKAFDPAAEVTLTVPATVTEVQSFCFDSSGLYAVKLNANISRLDTYMFNLCHTLRSVELSDTIRVFAEGAFYGCASLQDVKLPTTLKDLGRYAFTDCKALQTVELPATLNVIPSGTFTRCSSLEEFVIPATIEKIGDNAFSHCSSLEELVIPATIKEIGRGAFICCAGLEKVIISAGVSRLGGYAFSDCVSLKTVVFEGDAPETGENPFGFARKLMVFYPQENGTWTQDRIEQISAGGYVNCFGYTGDMNDHNMQWHSDENVHWVQCTDCDFGFREEAANHMFYDDGVCIPCGYVQYSEHNLQWILVDAYHSHECVDCGWILMQAEHRYDSDNICVDCGYDPTTQETLQETQSSDTQPPQSSDIQLPQNDNPQELREHLKYFWIIPGIILAVVVWVLLKKKKTK